MTILYKLLKQDPDTREGIITTTSALGIIVNVLIAAVKIVIGLLVSSVAIVSEGTNNATDALSSIMTLIGAKLARKHPDEKHPFGYGRIEYLSSLVISGIILFAGIEALTGSVALIFEPQEMTVSYVSIAIIAFTAVVKLFLAFYTIKKGKEAESVALVAVGTECRSDSFASLISIVSSLIFIIFGLSLDAYAGIIISCLIIKAGFDALKETVGDILGRPGDHDLAVRLYKEIKDTDGIIGAADMILHNYGPDEWSGSVNVEIDHSKTVGEIYEFLHALQLRIMHEYHVTMVFGVYAVDNDRAETKALREAIAEFVRNHEHLKSYHAVYRDTKNMVIYCDFIVDYELKDWDAVQASFKEYMAGLYPEYGIELTIETEFI